MPFLGCEMLSCYFFIYIFSSFFFMYSNLSFIYSNKNIANYDWQFNVMLIINFNHNDKSTVKLYLIFD